MVGVRVQHPVQRAGNCVRGTIADTAQTPVVFDEAKGRTLGRSRDDRRNSSVRRKRSPEGADHIRNARFGLFRSRRLLSALHSDQLRGAGHRHVGLVHDRTHHMVVPAVGVVVQNDDCGFLLLVGPLQRVDRVHEKDLFIQRIGVVRMAVLDSARLQEAHRRYVVCVDGITKVCDVVFVVCQY